MIPAAYVRRIESLLKQLGIPPGYGVSRSLPLRAEASELERHLA
ncbi:MAG: hypothetical protein ACREFX_03735 [Opitutaceae bacterium]